MKPVDPRLLRNAPSVRAFLAQVGAGAVAGAVLLIAEAGVLANTLAGVVDHRDPDLARAGIAIAVLVAAQAGLTRWTARTADRAARRATTELRRAYLGRILDDGTADPPGEVAALAGAGIDGIGTYTSAYLPALVAVLVVPPIVVTRMLLADLTSGLVLLVTLPLAILFLVLVGVHTADRTSRSWAGLQRLSGHLFDVISGLPTLRLFGRVPAQRRTVAELGERHRRATMATLRVAFLSSLVLELVATLSVAVVAVSVGLRLVDGHIGLETAFVVLLLAPACFAPLRRLGLAHHAATDGRDAAEEVLATLERHRPEPGTLPVPGRIEIDLDGVSVEHRGRRSPDAATLHAEPGELVVVVGPNGAGKTTLLQVLRQRARPETGSAAVAGIDLSQIEPAAWRAAVAWIPQRPVLGPGTVADQLRSGCNHATARDVADVAGRLGLGSLLDRPARTTSAGERQRIAVGRAVIRATSGGARLILADEPTANLDPDRAAVVVEELRRLADLGATVVAVTHRSEVRGAADRIVQLATSTEVVDVVGAARTGAAPPTASPTTVEAPLAATGAAPEGARGPAAGAEVMGTWRWLWSAGADARRPLVLAMAAAVGSALCGLALLGSAAWLLARASQHPGVMTLGVVVVAVRAFALGKAGLRYGERVASHDAVLRVTTRLRNRLFDRLAVLAPAGLPRGSGGSALGSVVDSLQTVQEGWLRVVLPPAIAALVGVAAVGAAALLLPAAGVAAAVAIVMLVVVVPMLAVRWGATATADLDALRRERTVAIADLAEAAEEVAAYGGTLPHDLAGDEQAADLLADHVSRVDTGTDAAAEVVAGSLAAILLVVAGSAAIGGRLDPLLVPPLVLVAVGLPEVFRDLPAAARRLRALQPTVRRLDSLVRAQDPTPPPAHPMTLPTGPIGLSVHDLVLGWPGEPEPVLDGFDLDVAAGTCTVLLGASGSGKSTLAAGLVRFLLPARGTIELGGTPVADLSTDAACGLVGWCEQDARLFDTSIRANLLVARPGAADDELWSALRQVRLDGWVAGLPDGLDTAVGVAGQALSGGEAQRLCLARVLLADRPVVVLDEPTANLDPEAAETVMRDLIAAAGGRTTLVLTHRTEGTEAADQVVTLAAGRVLPPPRELEGAR